MEAERWNRVEQLFQAALELEVEQRAEFLRQACAGDEGLRREVESLLAFGKDAETFIETPAFEEAAQALAMEHRESRRADVEARGLEGKTVSHYRVVEKLGGGGMGIVYKARDMKLGRFVALKFLPSDLAKDHQAIERFRREAHAASALNHPNICTIYDIDEYEGVPFIAMEFLSGRTLSHCIANKPLLLDQLLDLAIQISRALEAAHTQGIIHRDIKPANVFFSNDGTAKILDFGVSKLVHGSAETAAASITALGTASQDSVTSPGDVLGTVMYMSPEQIRGEELDARSDLFSLGVVLYEMATGRGPFTGNTSGVIVEAILNRAPLPAAQLNPTLPPQLEEVINKALEKDRNLRYHHASDIRTDLQRLKRNTESDKAAVTLARKRLWPRSTAVSVGALLAIVVVLAWAVTAYFYPFGKIDSVAVLPFVNASNDPNAEYLSDGLTDNLIDRLSNIPNLRVMSHSAVFLYKGTQVDPQAVGRDLHVQAVLTGRVIQHGDTLEVRMELVDAHDDSHIWGEAYHRTSADTIALQADIVKAVAKHLRLRLSAEQERQLAKRYTDNPEAYRLYLKAIYFAGKYSKDGLDKGIDYLHQAIALDPNYALAYDGLAYYYRVASDWFMSMQDAMPKAKEAAEKALALDDTLAQSHVEMGEVHYWFDWDWQGAEHEFKRAIELNPNYALAHQDYGWYLICVGRTEQGLAEITKAVDLDPLSAEASTFLGMGLYRARRYDQAIKQLRNTLEFEPSYWLAHAYLGRTYEQAGSYSDAVVEFEKAAELEPHVPELWSLVGHAYAVSGEKGKARKLLEGLNKKFEHSYVSPYNYVLIYTGLGNKDEALAWLEKAYRERSVSMTYLRADPQFDPLRDDPRFQDLLRRVGLAQ